MTFQGPSSPPQPLPRPPRTKHLPFAVLLGGPALLFLVTGTLGYFYSVGVRTQNVTMGDRTLLITIPELLELQKVTGYDPKAEVLKKSKLSRGGRQLEYRYGAPTPPWRIDSRVIAELDPMQAQTTYRHLADTGLKPEGLGFEPHDFTWGDEAQLGTLLRDGAPMGYSFLGRKGTHVVMYRLEGLVMTPPMTFEALVASHLGAAEMFAP